MNYTRREFGKLALAGLPAAALLETPLFGSALVQAKPNSKFGGVQIGVITYSYRSMPDQSAEATLKYVLDSGISAIELMDGPREMFAGAPAARRAPAAALVVAAVAVAGGPWRDAGAAGAPLRRLRLRPSCPDSHRSTANRVPVDAEAGARRCARCRAGGGAGAGAAAAVRRAGAAAPAAAVAVRPRPSRWPTRRYLKKWRTSVSMDKFKALRKMYNDAGVTMYAYKSDGMQKNMQTSDEELDYLFNVAPALGASHTTMELPSPGADGTAMLKRMAQFAEKHKIYVAYHTHGQGSMTAFDEALAMSKWNMSNVDLGHYVAAGNNGGTPLEFLEKFHGRIASFHLKDRTLPEHCSLTVPFGTGDGQIKDILLLMKKNKWTFPASIELESPIPAGSDAVQEVRKSVMFCKDALA